MTERKPDLVTKILTIAFGVVTVLSVVGVLLGMLAFAFVIIGLAGEALGF